MAGATFSEDTKIFESGAQNIIPYPYYMNSAGMATHSEDTTIAQTYHHQDILPDHYYLNQPCPGQTIGGVQEALGLGITRPYVNGTFDCSNMASYVQWVLKSHGYNAKICISEHFKGNGCHAWVEVDLGVERYYIETTQEPLMLMGSWNTNYNDYNHPERCYTDLHDAINDGYHVEWFNWWD